MSRYVLFYGAPSATDLRSDHEWKSISPDFANRTTYTLPPSTLASANRRISNMYENVIFMDQDDVSEDIEEDSAETTAITWPPTFQRTDGSLSKAYLSRNSLGGSRFLSQFTQETQDNFADSHTSSIIDFPAFHFSLHSLTSLDNLLARASYDIQHGLRQKQSQKINLLAAVLDKGPEAGTEISVLKLVLGDDSDGICQLTAWRGVADEWAGYSTGSPSIKKGDVVFIENPDAPPVACSASPQYKSTLMICYRTMPAVAEDARLRPDLRLGLSDAAVRKVATLVRWFEGMAGLS
ncbi:uncharacterized protein BXZ73DRAFT_91848 [Epithele typhae]|uniref:uncharacterized protein n=1 Tax=Epithele typhae TaxID=378194 RepID=UPI002007D5AE|nr:uncharacterized protein BXZ73DRAFT_91848 [Epithele typhae]KAH9921239.1 hypothetical protein BXZ73DRAFT_91848 [Epithele typhae]